MRKMIGALALLVMAAVPLRAQEHQHAQQPSAQHGDHARMMMTHHAAHAALMHRQELGLSADQVQRLTAIDSAQTRAMREHCSRMEAAGGHTAQNHDAMHQEMRASMERQGQAALAILTPAQKAQLDSLHAAHHGPGAAQHGEHAGHGEGHAAHHGAGQASAQGAAHAEHGNASAHDCAECCKEMGGHAGHTAG